MLYKRIYNILIKLNLPDNFFDNFEKKIIKSGKNYYYFVSNNKIMIILRYLEIVKN